MCLFVSLGVVCIGAKKEGFLGFLKGTGKGVIGLVLRPTGGLIDFTSTTLSVVQKYALILSLSFHLFLVFII